MSFQNYELDEIVFNIYQYSEKTPNRPLSEIIAMIMEAVSYGINDVILNKETK